jgi:hypothetical protein
VLLKEKTMTSEPEKISWTGHDKYFKLVDKNMARIETIRIEQENFLDGIMSRGNSDDDVDVIITSNDEIEEIAHIVIVFSALTLEAYINHYGINRISGNYFTKYLDRLDLIAKWIIVPKVVTGKQLDPGSKAMQELEWLVALRNRLVHYKSKKITVDNLSGNDFLWYEDAERAIRAVIRIVNALREIDPDAEMDWLNG